jgi:hypothetical protein
MQNSNLSNSDFDSYRAVGSSVQSCPLVWIEIELVDEDDQPVSGESYRIELADGKTEEGSLDEKGFARVDGIPKGNCKVTFPNLDKEAWEKRGGNVRIHAT